MQATNQANQQTADISCLDCFKGDDTMAHIPQQAEALGKPNQECSTLDRYNSVLPTQRGLYFNCSTWVSTMVQEKSQHVQALLSVILMIIVFVKIVEYAFKAE